MKLLTFSLLTSALLVSACKWKPFTLLGCETAAHQRDRTLYRAMQLERRAMALEYGNLTNVNALQDIIERNGIERSKLEGLWK